MSVCSLLIVALLAVGVEASYIWSNIIANGAGGSPPGRLNMPAVLYGKSMVIFGGRCCSSGSSDRYNDVWELDLGNSTPTWSNRIANGAVNSPGKRDGHISVLYGTKMVVFGGYTSGYLNDFWELELTNNTWKNIISNGDGSSPAGRRQSSAVLYGVKMVVFGGEPFVNDLWEIDLSATTPSWSNLISNGAAGSPIARGYHSAALNGNQMYIFGGFDGAQLNDLWKIDLSAAGPTWNNLIVNDAPGSPSRRYTSTMVVHGTKLILFGGSNGGNEIWSLVNDTWSQHIASGGPPAARQEHAAVLCGAKMIVFGGQMSSTVYNDAWQLTLPCPTHCITCSSATVCAECANETYPNASGVCTPWSNCSSGEQISFSGNGTQNRECEACVTGYTNTTNIHSCYPWSDCTAGQYISTNGTSTSDRVCSSCASGKYSPSANAFACADWTNCAAGQKIAANGTISTDRTCVACPAGKFSTASNQNKCTNWTTCNATTEIESSAGSKTADRVCAPAESSPSPAGSSPSPAGSSPSPADAPSPADSPSPAASAMTNASTTAVPNKLSTASRYGPEIYLYGVLMVSTWFGM